MSRQVWLISTLACVATIAFYLLWEHKNGQTWLWAGSHSAPLSPSPKLSPTPLPALTSTEGDGEEKQHYRKWLEVGQAWEAKGNLAEALRCYSFALTYQPDKSLEKRVAELGHRLREESGLAEDLWEKACVYERQGDYGQALLLYEKLASHKALPEIQTKITFSRQILEREHTQEKMLQQGQALISQGEWVQATRWYEKIGTAYEKWLKIKENSPANSPKLTAGREFAKEMVTSLKQLSTALDPLLEEGRSAQALRYIAGLSTNLPTAGFLKKIQEILDQEMAFVPAGPFVMGSEVEPEEMPQQTMTLAAYYIDRYEVTNRRYQSFVKSTGHPLPLSWKESSLPKNQESHPVSGVSWEDATQYAHWVGKRLPTEAEWEKAARGSDGRVYPWGNTFLPDHCNSLESKLQTPVPVGSFPKGRSPFGCFDMAGNVLEWTADLYAPYPGGTRPIAVQPNHRVARGGAWYYSGNVLRCSHRYPHDQTNVRLITIGFRCALSYETTK